MKSFIFWSDVYNSGLALTLMFPPLLPIFGLECSGTFMCPVAGFLAYTSAVLILASHNFRHCASLVYSESILRYIAVLLLIILVIAGMAMAANHAKAITDELAWMQVVEHKQ